MFDLTNFTPWQLFCDAGVIFGLLLIGKLCRAKIKAIQSLFIPPSLIAGVLALAFGPNGLGWLPLSNNLGTYSAILIAVVFAALPLASPTMKIKEIGSKLGPMWAYSQFGMFFQWAAIGIIGILLLTPLFNVPEFFGIMCPVGFYGGHGTAAAMATEFGEGFEETARSLGMTTATVGVVLGVIFGVLLIKIATKKHQTSYVTDFAELPNELRSGLVPEEKRDNLGKATVSSISIDHFAMHLGIVIFAAYCGYLLSDVLLKGTLKISGVPVFLTAYVVGMIFKVILDATKASRFVEQKTISNISGTATDLLVTCGVGAINLNVVTANALPLIVLLAIGIAITLFMVFYFARHLYTKDWFEKAIFAWGWWTGTMAIGIALLRIVDPKNESHALDNYAMAFLPCAPVEIILIWSVPVAFKGGWLLWLCVGYLVLSLLILLLAKRLGWWIPSKALKGGVTAVKE
ncbi:MAG: sodium:glutamate symporter [Bacteroidales bacterium]|nr:sodium:glutamate symporter [Bacteroidales bacterium]